jgi:hypothetical protein
MGSTIKLNWNFIPITGKRFAARVFQIFKKREKKILNETSKSDKWTKKRERWLIFVIIR